MSGASWYFQDDTGNEQGPVDDHQLSAVLLLGDRFIREYWDQEWHMASEYFAEEGGKFEYIFNVEGYTTRFIPRVRQNGKPQNTRTHQCISTNNIEQELPAKYDNPFDDPAPELIFKNKIYVFTGDFEYGERVECMAEAARRGARCDKRVTRETDVLVVGKRGSEYWVGGNYGTKIETALRYKLTGSPIVIISEDHWVKSLV